MPDHPDAQGEDSRAGGGRTDSPQTDESERWRERYDAETVLTVQRIWSATSREDVARYVWEDKAELVEALEDAIEDQDELAASCNDYLRDKYRIDERLAKNRAVLMRHTAKPVEGEGVGG